MYKFSLIIPTRGRYDYLIRCIDSFVNNAKYKDQLEIVVMHDSDDHSFDVVWPLFVERCPSNIVSIMRKRQGRKADSYDNWGAARSTGKYVWVLNDDVVCETKNWDSKAEFNIERFLEDRPDRVCYGMVDDGGPHYMFPMITREYVNCMGGIFSKELPGQVTDTVLYKIIKNLDYDIILDLGGIIKVQPTEMFDTTAIEMRNASQAQSLSETEFMHYVNKLNNYIKGRRMILGGDYYDHNLRLLEMWVENFGEGRNGN